MSALPEGERERLLKIPFRLNCPNCGVSTDSGYSLWYIQVLSEHPGTVEFECKFCNSAIRYEPATGEIMVVFRI